MIDESLKNRINELARKEKSEGLTFSEKKEQDKLRKEYLKQFRAGLRQTLENTKVIDPKGNDITPKRKENA